MSVCGGNENYTLNNNTCTFRYPLSLQRNNHASSHPKLLDTNKSSISTAALLWFYFGCLFVNVYKDLHFHFLNVLKTTVTGMLSWVSITSLALQHLSFLLVPCLWEGTNSDLQASEVPVQWWSGWQAITGIKQMRQRRTIADRARTKNVTTGLYTEEMFPLLNIIILCSTCTLKGNSLGSSFTWNFANLATSQIHCCVFEVNTSH